MNGTREYARDALVQHLLDHLPAELEARDAARRARLVCRPGPYSFEAEASLNVNGAEATIEAGSYTAAELAAALELEGASASEDADGRLVLASSTAPGEEGASVLEVGPGTANKVLGIRPATIVEIPLGHPELSIYDHGPDMGRIDLTGPTICLVESQVAPQRDRESAIVRIRLEVFFPGPQAEDRATLRALGELVAAIDATIKRGDGRGHWMIGGWTYERVLRCFPLQWRVRDHVWQLADGAVPRPFGRSQPEYEIRVWDPVGV